MSLEGGKDLVITLMEDLCALAMHHLVNEFEKFESLSEPEKST